MAYVKGGPGCRLTCRLSTTPLPLPLAQSLPLPFPLTPLREAAACRRRCAARRCCTAAAAAGVRVVAYGLHKVLKADAAEVQRAQWRDVKLFASAGGSGRQLQQWASMQNPCRRHYLLVAGDSNELPAA